MKKHFLAWTLIFAGMAAMLYPAARAYYCDFQQQRLMEVWQDSLQVIDEGNYTHDDAEPEPAAGFSEQENQPEQPEQEEDYGAYVKQQMEGILAIPRIDLRMPILKGATEHNLNISVASLKNTGKPGQGGNYVLAGHRSHTYGRHFNRLEELEIGDVIQVDTGDEHYEYIVAMKLYVEPEDTWVLSSSENLSEITLITCHPMLKPTQRLIIKGKLYS